MIIKWVYRLYELRRSWHLGGKFQSLIAGANHLEFLDRLYRHCGDGDWSFKGDGLKFCAVDEIYSADHAEECPQIIPAPFLAHE